MSDNLKILQKAYSDLKAQQETELVVDFDEAVKQVKPIKIKYGKRLACSKLWYWICRVLGYVGIDIMDTCYEQRVFVVPGETPVWYMNIINRKLHEIKSVKLDELSEEELIERLEIDDNHNEMIFRRLLGDEFVDSYMADNFVSWKLLNDAVLNPILVKWGWKAVEDTSEKKSSKVA